MRYKQTAIGIAWSVLRPFLTMVVFTVVFSKLAKLPSDGFPYPVLVYALFTEPDGRCDRRIPLGHNR